MFCERDGLSVISIYSVCVCKQIYAFCFPNSLEKFFKLTIHFRLLSRSQASIAQYHEKTLKSAVFKSKLILLPIMFRKRKIKLKIYCEMSAAFRSINVRLQYWVWRREIHAKHFSMSFSALHFIYACLSTTCACN